MIQNSPTGGRTILSVQQFRPRGDKDKPIVPFFAGTVIDPPFRITATFTLKNGHLCYYRYSYAEDTTDGQIYQAYYQLNGDPANMPNPNAQPWGGEFYNASVRGTLISKTDLGLP